MKPLAVLFLALLIVPSVPPVIGDPPMTCTPVGPCVPLQREIDDLTSNLGFLTSQNVGWINLDPTRVQIEPLVALPGILADDAVEYTGSLATLLSDAGLAVVGETSRTSDMATTWTLGTVDDGSTRAAQSVFHLRDAGDAFLVVTIWEAEAWISFVNSAGVTLSSAAVSSAETAPGSTVPAVQRAVSDGHPEAYVLRKATEALDRVSAFLADPPTDAVQRDVDENGLGDTWESTVCRSRLGAPGLPSDACTAVDSEYRMARSYATVDFDYDGLDLVEEFRWNSDPVDFDTDEDGLPDGAEADLWRRTENDLVVNANLWGCPSTSDVGAAPACAWRHPDSFRDDDSDGLYNIGQDPSGALASLGAGDADSEGDGLTEGDEYYGCLADPEYGANAHPGPGIPDFVPCKGVSERGHHSDPALDDTDEDGLDDVQEVCSWNRGACSREASYDTDPLNPDTDGDAWHDGDEAAFWRGGDGWFNDIDHDDILNNLADPDSDRDGIQDGIENQHPDGLRADLIDTDADGMPDDWEIRNLFDPTDPADGGIMDESLHRCQDASSLNDADGDGLCNEFEYAFLRPTEWDEAHDGEWTSVLNPKAADLDRDQLNDAEEVFPDVAGRSARQSNGVHSYGADGKYPGYPGSTRVDLGDSDGDNLPDNVEWTQASSYGSFTNPNVQDSDADGLDDKSETSTDPADWDTDNDTIGDGQDENPLTPAPPQAGCGEPADCDRDGLDDSEEVATADGEHCLRGNADTDNDGLLDGWEILGTTPGDRHGYTSKCTTANSDEDTLTDDQEVQVYTTDPRQVDTDQDQASDSDEVYALLVQNRGAHHMAMGTYLFTADSCTGNPACTTPGATNPTDNDSDEDGLEDGAELKGIPWYDTCVSDSCLRWFTNPNRADTDGDTPTVLSLDDGQEVTRFVNNCQYNPVDYDTDHDHSPDGTEAYIGTDACAKDTDHDMLSDGAEAAIGSDPKKKDTDKDGFIDFSDQNPLVENNPPIIMAVRPYRDDYRTGVCITPMDASSVRILSAQTMAWNDPPLADSTYVAPGYVSRAADVARQEWDTSTDPDQLCLPFTGIATDSIEQFWVTLTDDPDGDAATPGSTARISGHIDVDQPYLDELLYFEAATCWIPFGVGEVSSIVIGVIRHDRMKEVEGTIGIGIEAVEARMAVNGIALTAGQTAMKKFLKIGCAITIFKSAMNIYETTTGPTRVTAQWETETDGSIHRFSFRGDAYVEAFLATEGHAESMAVGAGTADPDTEWRGEGVAYFEAKYPAVASADWISTIDSVLTRGAHSIYWTPVATAEKFSKVVDGHMWHVVVIDRKVVDVTIEDA